MKIEKKRKAMSVKGILAIQCTVALYSMAGVMGKFAAGYDVLSKGFCACYAVEILLLGGYAIIWQQVIKQFDLSVAYANRAMALLWSMLWAVTFFKESISVQNMIGVVVVLMGTMLVNCDGN